ncbi:hypothetical protein [Polyangium mundeleinium]|uniref:Uncharacterized protein n=1 Tax=Polyangium mundeleinium TaxID=2995306 RepID=A0ABT5ENA6_9BACT|nr:hypothetical protein [Polyangium mundeleinium]MDC0743315.1 hypothetical protein [Polyangium mundeleinium]
MTRILVCWEDQHNAKLDQCLRRALRHTLGDTGASTPELHRHGVRGHGGFAPFIRDQWPSAAKQGSPGSRGPIDYLVCIADADKATTCCPIEAPPKAPAPTDGWVTRASNAWTVKLRSSTNFDPDRIHGHFLRWNSESLLIAAHDVDPALQKLQCRNREALAAFLRGCDPIPGSLPSELFVEHFRKPQGCLEKMLAAGGAPPHRKGSVPRDDALDEASRTALDRLLGRVPDLLSIAQLLQRLADAGAPTRA